MKYKFNGIEIDTKLGSPNLGIPAGNCIPAREGDLIEIAYGVRWTVPCAGYYEIGPDYIRKNGNLKTQD